MAHQRINMSHREAILHNVIEHAFRARRDEIEKLPNELGNDVYNDVYSKAQREMMASIPEGFLPQDDNLRVQFDGVFERVEWSNARDGSQYRRIAQKHRQSVAKQYGANHPLTIRFEGIVKARTELDAEQRQARASAKVILWSATTFEKLLHIWPAAEQFVRPYMGPAARPPITALAVKIEDLNKTLGLPPAVAA